MNLQEDYCSSEIAKLLKEKGFDGWCDYFYDDPRRQELRTKNGEDKYWNGHLWDDEYAAPTHQMAMRWLRENNIIITPQPEYFSCDRCESWGIDIWAFGNYEKLPGDFPKYEEAVEAALKYCLTKLI